MLKSYSEEKERAEEMFRFQKGNAKVQKNSGEEKINEGLIREKSPNWEVEVEGVRSRDRQTNPKRY
jgi:hypothetical protein